MGVACTERALCALGRRLVASTWIGSSFVKRRQQVGYPVHARCNFVRLRIGGHHHGVGGAGVDFERRPVRRVVPRRTRRTSTEPDPHPLVGVALNFTVYFPALTSETDSVPADAGLFTVTRNVCSNG